MDKHERLARLYDAEVWPLFGQRFAQMILRQVNPRPAATLLELGCATGLLTVELARRFDAESHVSALDTAPLLMAQAQQRIEADPELAARITLAPAPGLPLPVADATFDIAVSCPAPGDDTDAQARIAELCRVLRPGGQVVASLALRGTWAEFLDIYRDVLQENKKADSLTALDSYIAAHPDGETVARWLEDAGLRDVEVSVERWEILFKSAREFFFAPVIELGPLPRWKQMAGRGEEMQDTFFFVKEAIDAYFTGTVFPVTVVAGCVKGWKPINQDA